ncbi:hypothetical protein J2T02_004394 [Chitinophaga terrae (ex Kim and Jung 2007)]|uniref:DUF4199 domain-containing protein n=1 Tax=Chitinophaga terrae (ex Kim and Jung 2007) TaxID=408074 RepID=UPI00277EF378|nr:DUF4199 domain-containing protein [Chitinophaga terrae (ex Kim and Jung 2007)]MDQ0109251.1 hypothetical protein [Chitinophaga terrae (ex Kim and Jung 2007)]
MKENANPGVKWGIIAGIVMVLWYLAEWKMGTDYFFSYKLRLVSLVAWAVMALMAGLEARKQQHGYIGFKAAIKPIFTTYVISTLIVAIFTYLLYTVIDPSLVETSRTYLMKDTEWLLKAMKAPQEEIDKQLKDIKTGDNSITVTSTILDYLKNLIKFFVWTVVLALIVRRKAPQPR